MLSRRDYLKAFCAAYLLPIGGTFAAEPKEAWSRKAFAAAGSSLQAVKWHAFLRGVFDGTLSKRTFAAYLCQNISYLDTYASCLDLLAARLSQIQGFEQEARELKQWARETRDMRVWTIDYVKSFTGQSVNPSEIVPLPELLTYQGFEARAVRSADLGVAMAALLPCFWIWNEFGKALRPTAKLQDNPFRDWVEGMGSEASDVSARKAVSIADKLAQNGSDALRARMTDVFVAGCWFEWQLFEVVSHN